MNESLAMADCNGRRGGFASPLQFLENFIFPLKFVENFNLAPKFFENFN